MSEGKSYRQILRSSSIIGCASILNTLIGVLRIKVAAILLGPTGIGLISLFNNLVTTASTLSGLGFGMVGTRQIAEAAGTNNETAIMVARRALLWGTSILALVGAGIFWLLRNVLADRVLHAPQLGGTVGWMAVGVALTVAATSQGAMLNGLRCIGDLARVSVFSSLLSTALGIVALLLWGHRGLIAFILTVPLASFLFGHIYVARLPKAQGTQLPLRELGRQWKMMASLGAAFMFTQLVGTLVQLLVRTLVQHRLGLDAVGYYQAASAISMTYIGFVLNAMGTDYYSRLTAAIHHNETANRLVNEQTEVALLMITPILLGMLGCAPWVIEAFYSHRFHEAIGILRWQVLGDVFKTLSWPLGFLILAAGDGKGWCYSETFINVIFVAFIWLGLPVLGLEATGIAFLIGAALYLPIAYRMAKKRTNFQWQKGILRHFLVIALCSTVVAFIAVWLPMFGAVIGLLLSFAFGLHALGRLSHMSELGGPLAKLGEYYRRAIGKLSSSQSG